MISFAECATAEISNDGYVRPMSILRQCRIVLRRETSFWQSDRLSAARMSGPPSLFSIVICLLNTYTPSTPFVTLINTCVLGGGGGQ